MAASPLRVPGDTRTSVQYSELHSRPCSRSYRTPGNAEQHGSMVLLSQMHSAHRASESAHPPPEHRRVVPRSTRSNTPCSSASRSCLKLVLVERRIHPNRLDGVLEKYVRTHGLARRDRPLQPMDVGFLGQGLAAELEASSSSAVVICLVVPHSALETLNTDSWSSPNCCIFFFLPVLSSSTHEGASRPSTGSGGDRSRPEYP